MKSKIIKILGLLILIDGFCLMSYNFWDNKRAGNEAKKILDDFKIVRNQVNIDDIAVGQKMVSIDVGGYNLIGTIRIQKVDIELPVIDGCNDSKMKKAPCLYKGNVLENNMIIAGHAYETIFRSLSRLKSGDKIVFEDLSGKKYNYLVTKRETLFDNEVAKMLSGRWDITLFTCSFVTNERITVRAKRIL